MKPTKEEFRKGVQKAIKQIQIEKQRRHERDIRAVEAQRQNMIYGRVHR